MDDNRFDRVVRSLAEGSSRRALGRGIAATALGLAAGRAPDAAHGKQKKKKKDPKTNVFGCVDVGNACRGKNGLCCSHICEGKKPKKGRKDTSRCVAHDSGACQPGDDFCLGNEVACGAEDAGTCVRTTGSSPFCALMEIGVCTECNTDQKCQVIFGPGAACVICPSECLAILTACISAAPL